MVNKNGEKPVVILLVEDNPGDVWLIKEILHENDFLNKLYVVGNGEDAIDFLHKRNKFSKAPLPDLVLLDLNLPRKDGRDVLSEIKTDPELCDIPVIVLTSSGAEQDMLKSYECHANCYITKPINLDEFVKVIKSIKDFWGKMLKRQG